VTSKRNTAKKKSIEKPQAFHLFYDIVLDKNGIKWKGYSFLKPFSLSICPTKVKTRRIK